MCADKLTRGDGMTPTKGKAQQVGRLMKLITFGDMSLYRRMWYEPGIIKYVIFRESDCRTLYECRTKRLADAWMAEHG